MVERTDIGCLLINSAVDSSVVATALGVAAGLTFPFKADDVVDAQPRRVLWLTPRSWLVHCRIEEEQMLAKRINDAFPDKRAHAALYTDYLCWFDLQGPQAFTLLTEGGFVSLERDGLGVGHAKRTSIAGVAAVIVHELPQDWLIGVERCKAMYFANWLRAAENRRRSNRCGPS
jgi:heterotetrameric sarcosine oxidase gamma subunit